MLESVKFSFKFDVRRLCLFSLLVALCGAVQVLPRPPGLEFTSLLTFCVGVLLGGFFGALLGASVMFVNAFLSPYGVAGLSAPFQIVGMCIIGVVGGFYKLDGSGKVRFYFEAAVAGAALTLLYYTITNLSFAVALSLPPSQMPLLDAIVFSQVSGIVFTGLYMVSNTILFGVGVIPLVMACSRFLRR